MPDIVLPHNFVPRFYQERVVQAVDNGIKRVLLVWHRRAGKDKLSVNILAKLSALRIGTYFYYLPTQTMARKIIWEGQDKDGFPFRDHFPADYIKRISERDMRIEFVNGSAFQLIGTDNLTVVGTNPVGCLFSEYSLQNPKAFDYIQPILRENDGFALLNGTPRGHNHMYDLLKKVEHSPDWHVEVKTIEDTGSISAEEIENDIQMGLISREMALQEYYCSFEMGIEGSYYSRALTEADEDERIGRFPVDDAHPVYTFWDLGIDNAMGVWFAQFYNGRIYVIDYYEKTNEGMEHYAEMLKEKDYAYGGHFAPWDITRRELSSGLTVQRMAEEYGIFFDRVKRTASITDDIELVRKGLKLCYFNSDTCHDGVNMLRLYHAKKDERMSTEGRPVFSNKPEHDYTSNCADAFRTLHRAVELRMISPKPYAQIGYKGGKPMAYNDSYLKKTTKKPSLRKGFGNFDVKKINRESYL